MTTQTATQQANGTGETTQTKPIEAAAIMPGINAGKRRIPEYLKKYLLTVQGGNLYLPAAYRLVWFREECPDWGISTSLIEGGCAAGLATVQAIIYEPGGRIIGSGMKTETKADFPAGWVEKAETGAISRALAVCGFSTQFGGDLDDPDTSPQHATRQERSRGTAGGRNDGDLGPTAVPGQIWEGEGQCPRCRALNGKRHFKPCV